MSGEAAGARISSSTRTRRPRSTPAVVTLDIADDADSRALTSLDVRVQPRLAGRRRGVASGVMPLSLLPPGRYVARARITRDGKAVGVLARPFVLERAAGATVLSATTRMAAAKAFAATLPAFDRQAVLGARLRGRPMLDIVEKRSADVEGRDGRGARRAIRRRRARGARAPAIRRRPRSCAALDLFSKGQWNQAATQLQIAAGDRREFFPAAFYLGATFAALGRDRDAAGVWQLALGTEPRPAVVYAMVADARLRDGQAQAAIDILKPAYESAARQRGASRAGWRWPTCWCSDYADAIPVLDATLARRSNDQEALVASLVAHYELVRGGAGAVDRRRGQDAEVRRRLQGPRAARCSRSIWRRCRRGDRRSFWHGCNYPWSTDGTTVFYGLDFGANVWGSHLGVSTRRDAVARDFDEMARLGFTVVALVRVLRRPRRHRLRRSRAARGPRSALLRRPRRRARDRASPPASRRPRAARSPVDVQRRRADAVADPVTGERARGRGCRDGRARRAAPGRGPRARCFARVLEPMVRRYGPAGRRARSRRSRLPPTS